MGAYDVDSLLLHREESEHRDQESERARSDVSEKDAGARKVPRQKSETCSGNAHLDDRRDVPLIGKARE